MYLRQVLRPEEYKAFATIGHQCEAFLEASQGVPVLKNLSTDYSDLQKVKVRKRKRASGFAKVFNEAFDEQFVELRQRAVFANGLVSLTESEADEEPFYIFPIDGFHYLYSTEVENSSAEYRTVFDAIFETLDADAAEQTFRDLLKFTYKSTDLREGIESGAEIIIYNIPYYYAVRQSIFESYGEVLSLVHGE